MQPWRPTGYIQLTVSQQNAAAFYWVSGHLPTRATATVRRAAERVVDAGESHAWESGQLAQVHTVALAAGAQFRRSVPLPGGPDALLYELGDVYVLVPYNVKSVEVCGKDENGAPLLHSSLDYVMSPKSSAGLDRLVDMLDKFRPPGSHLRLVEADD